MRALSLILAVIMLFAMLVACSDETTEQSNADLSKTESSVAATESDDESVAVSEDETSEDATSEDATSEDATSEDATSEDATSEDTTSEDATSEDETSEDETSEDEDEEEYELPTYSDVKIGKAATAPKVDGKVDKNEYATAIKFDMDETYWNYNSDEAAEDYDVVLYMSWDETYLYTAVKLRIGKPRTYDNTDFLSNRPWIFDRRHVMTAVTTGDPTDAKYLEPSGDPYWDWTAAYNSGLASEWTITAQPDGSNINDNHFGSVTTDANFQYVVGVADKNYEVYEQRIPWAALAGGASFTAEDGAIFGYAFSCSCEEIDISEGSEEESIYACFGGGIAFGKSFSEYVGITLVD